MMKPGIGLTEAIASVRRELVQAAADATDAKIRFPVGQVTLQFQVALTKAGEAGADVHLWVVDVSAAGQYAKEAIQTVTVVLEPPVDAHGRPIRVSSTSADIPG